MDLLSIQEETPVHRLFQPGYHIQQYSFTAAPGAEYDQKLIVVHIQRHVNHGV